MADARGYVERERLQPFFVEGRLAWAATLSGAAVTLLKLARRSALPV